MDWEELEHELRSGPTTEEKLVQAIEYITDILKTLDERLRRVEERL